MNLAAQLAQGLGALSVDSNEAQRLNLINYLALLQKWNKVYNLTAVREPERMLTHHVLDSLAVLPALGGLATGSRILDVGSGGGLPGIPLAIVRPDWDVTVLEPNQKKASFLRQAGAELALGNLVIAQQRVEDFPPKGAFDLVISRAFAELGDFLRAAAPFVAPKGRIAAMKGVYPDEEIAQLGPESAARLRVIRLEVPGLDAERHLLIFSDQS